MRKLPIDPSEYTKPIYSQSPERIKGHYIYTLTDKHGEIVYIGYTKLARRRWHEHRLYPHNKLIHAWIKGNTGYTFKIVLSCFTKEQALQAETYFIELARPILNSTYSTVAL